jgi:hypothetical protein
MGAQDGGSDDTRISVSIIVPGPGRRWKQT